MKNAAACLALAFALGFGLAFVVIDRYEIRGISGGSGFYKIDTFTGQVWGGNAQGMREISEREYIGK